MLYGNGASNNGTAIVTSPTFVWLASQSNQSWYLEVVVTCRTTGSAGTLFATGFAWCQNLVTSNVITPILLPATAPVVSAAYDLTASLIPSVQAIRSGSTAETMIVHQMQVTALN